MLTCTSAYVERPGRGRRCGLRRQHTLPPPWFPPGSRCRLRWAAVPLRGRRGRSQDLFRPSPSTRTTPSSRRSRPLSGETAFPPHHRPRHLPGSSASWSAVSSTTPAARKRGASWQRAAHALGLATRLQRPRRLHRRTGSVGEGTGRARSLRTAARPAARPHRRSSGRCLREPTARHRWAIVKRIATTCSVAVHPCAGIHITVTIATR